MNIVVIDCKGARRELIASWLRPMGHHVKPVPSWSALDAGSLSSDLLLLHVGATQGDNGNDLGVLLAKFEPTPWTIGYSGGAVPQAVENFSSSRFSIFPPKVAGDNFPLGMKNVISRVLEGVSGGGRFGVQEFKSIVTGFNPLLEIKLQTLLAVLRKDIVPATVLQILQKAHPEVVDLEREQLRLTSEDSVASAVDIRNKLFGS